eukprot:jgi/Mesvir1/3253/Mv16392-RA.1
MSAASQLDASKADRQVWLVKIPSAISTEWDQNKGYDATPLGRVRMTFDPTEGSDAEFSMILPKKRVKAGEEERSLPPVFTLTFSEDEPSMHVFSEGPPGTVACEGIVEHKGDLKPPSTAEGLPSKDYRRLCRERLQKSLTKTRTLQRMEADTGNRMVPLPTDHRAPVVDKAWATKRTRENMNRDDLENLILALFDESVHWSFKQLMDRTNIPASSLKEVLEELCFHNKRGPNKGLYEVKPEYKVKRDEDTPMGQAEGGVNPGGLS